MSHKLSGLLSEFDLTGGVSSGLLSGDLGPVSRLEEFSCGLEYVVVVVKAGEECSCCEAL